MFLIPLCVIDVAVVMVPVVVVGGGVLQGMLVVTVVVVMVCVFSPLLTSFSGVSYSLCPMLGDIN